MRIKLFLMRHSKSCSNHTRSAGNHEDPTDPAVIVSQAIRDPGLTDVGARNAKIYGPILKAKLQRLGFGPEGVIVAASSLRRAKDTASLVFGKPARSLGHFAENGRLPENTPAKEPYTAPDWNKFLGHLSAIVKEGDSVAMVGHGSYLRSLWPRLTGHAHKERLNNMDGILLDIDVSPRGCKVHSFKEIPYTGPTMMSADKCKLLDMQKIADISKRMTRKQRGGNGSTGMPLTYHTGNQPQTYSTTPTGVGLTDETANWIRPPMTQSGGRRSRKGSRRSQKGSRRSQKGSRRSQKGSRRSQKGGFGSRAQHGRHTLRALHGGFTAEIMGSFAANGARLMPIAAYLGYNMYKNQKKGRKTRKTRRT